jgi:hypothetical protein
MRRNDVIIAIAAVGFVLSCGYMLYKQLSPQLIDQFSVSTEQMTTDLNGQMVSLPYGQAWPFDPTQKVQVKVLGKKQVDQFVIVFANVQAQADVTPVKDKTEKPDPKLPAPPKLPSKVSLNGVLKMHYEQLNDQWYLVHVEGVNMKAQAQD